MSLNISHVSVSSFGHQVPQLWSRSLLEHGGDTASSRRVSTIAEIEAEKERDAHQKANERNVLAEAKKLGKEAHAAVKARLAQERAAASDAKKMEKLRIAAEQKAEKARLVAENKAKRAEARVRSCSFHLDSSSVFLFSRQQNGKRRHKSSKGFPKVNSVCLLPLHKSLPLRRMKGTRPMPATLKTSSCSIQTIPATS